MTNYKFVKPAAACVIGASLLTTSMILPVVDVSAKTAYKVNSKGKLVNAKTNKVVKGYKTYKGKLYKDGKKFTGIYKKKFYYKKGVKATGTYKGAYYSKGIKKVTTGLYKGKFYKNGALNVGLTLYKGKYYFNASLANGPIKDKNGEIKSYKNGLAVIYTVKTVPTVYVLADYTLASSEKGSKYTSDEPVVIASTKAKKTTLKREKGEYTVSSAPKLDAAFFKDKSGSSITSKTVNRIVSITETGEKISVPVTYSIEPAKTIKVETFKNGTKEQTSKVKVSGKVTKPYGLSDLLKAIDFKTTDQYGVQSEPLTAADEVTFTAVTGKAQFTNNTSKHATVQAATAGSVVNATVTKDGKSVTVELTFEHAFDNTPNNGGGSGTEDGVKVVSPTEFTGTSENPKVFNGTIQVDITNVEKLEHATINGNLILTGQPKGITFTSIKVNGHLDASGVKGSNISFDGIEVEEITL